MSLIKLNSIYKDYTMNGGLIHKVLKDINVEIKEGEFVCIMGPSGSGKSTLMNIMGCLDKPTSGNYHLKNTDIATLNSNKLAKIRSEQIGFVFQGFNLLHRRNIVDNVAMPLVYCNVCYKNRLKQAKKMIKLVGLEGYEFHLPNQLSGGMQQRVAIARALINNPSVIFADEPTGNLDTKTGEEIMNLFQQLNHEKKITIVVVTHESNIASYSNRIIHIKDGIRDFDGSISSAKKEGIL
ncbi:ABC transporter ATP-binding protein [Pseudomonadota bacterium]